MEERGIPDRVEMIRPSDGNEFEIRCHADQFVGIGLSWIKRKRQTIPSVPAMSLVMK